TFNISGDDGRGGVYEEASKLTMGHAPDVANYRDAVTDETDPDLSYTHTVDASWDGTPQKIIQPGQVINVHELVNVNLDPNKLGGARVTAYGLNTHLLEGVKLDLFNSQTAPQFASGGNTEDTIVKFTAPTGKYADFPLPGGGMLHLPVVKI